MNFLNVIKMIRRFDDSKPEIRPVQQLIHQVQQFQRESTHTRDRIMDTMITEKGFWRGIQQRISDALKSESSVKRDVNQQDMQVLTFNIIKIC